MGYRRHLVSIRVRDLILFSQREGEERDNDERARDRKRGRYGMKETQKGEKREDVQKHDKKKEKKKKKL